MIQVSAGVSDNPSTGIKPNVYKISARSDGAVNMSEVCQRLGGGGHVRAAGCTLEGDVNEIIEKILAEINAEYAALEEA